MSLFHIDYPRTLQARRPEGFTPAVPRYSLRWRRPVPVLISEYFGLQGQSIQGTTAQEFVTRMKRFLSVSTGPEAVEVMTSESDETGRPITIVVAYWTSDSQHATWCHTSPWRDWWRSPERLTADVGYWRESVLCPYDRHETVYSMPHYRIGFGRTAGAELATITDNGYFGAARDRIPLSAIDELSAPDGISIRTRNTSSPEGKRVAVVVPHNLMVMRSGQFWHDSEPEQADDYDQSLRPKLDHGMDYLEENRDEVGCVYLRRLTNVDDQLRPRRETSVVCAFQDYSGLESWAESHESHHAIFHHAIDMGRKYGPRRDVVTWHENFILPGGTLFEYLNCALGTGLTSVGQHLVHAD